MIIDAHTHINCDELYQERKEIIQRAIDNKVVAVFNTADSLNSFKNIDILQKNIQIIVMVFMEYIQNLQVL